MPRGLTTDTADSTAACVEPPFPRFASALDLRLTHGTHGTVFSFARRLQQAPSRLRTRPFLGTEAQQQAVCHAAARPAALHTQRLSTPPSCRLLEQQEKKGGKRASLPPAPRGQPGAMARRLACTAWSALAAAAVALLLAVVALVAVGAAGAFPAARHHQSKQRKVLQDPVVGPIPGPAFPGPQDKSSSGAAMASPAPAAPLLRASSLRYDATATGLPVPDPAAAAASFEVDLPPAYPGDAPGASASGISREAAASQTAAATAQRGPSVAVQRNSSPPRPGASAGPGRAGVAAL